MTRSAIASLVCCMASLTLAQIPYAELEIVGGQNDTFALAEDCTTLGNYFRISGTVHGGGSSNSDDEWFKFNASMGDTVDIDMTITMAISSGSTYQHNIWLYNSSQIMVAAWNTATGAPPTPSIGMETYTFLATDTYYIYVTEWSVSPRAVLQPTAMFAPLSTRGFAVTGTTPDSTRDTAGGLQTTGSTYEITVNVTPSNAAPTCAIIAPLPSPPTFSDDLDVVFDVDDLDMDPVDALLEYSTDGGVSFQPATLTPASPLGTNPAVGLGVPAPGISFQWDSRGDGVGISVIQATEVRITVDDGIGQGSCSVVVDIDNTQLCNGICGDCDESGTGVTILDSLTGAQISAGLTVPTAGQMVCCDVDSSSSVTILDALAMAQEAAGLMPVLVCP